MSDAGPSRRAERWAHEAVARRARQWPTLERLMASVERSPALDGMILVGSFARGGVDPLSDLDLVLVAADGRFEDAWTAREELHRGSSLAAWDQRGDELAEAGAHKWITRDLVLVECLLTTSSSGVRLAEPAAVLVGDPRLRDRFPGQPPVTRALMDAHPLELHPVERAYDDFKNAVRAARGLA